MKSQRDSSFPADGHKVIQIKWTISKRPTESERILTIRINHNRSTTLERSVINYWGVGWGGGLNRFKPPPQVLLWFIYTYKFFGSLEGLLLVNESNQWTYKSRFITEMKQDEYSTAKHDAGATEVKQLNANASGPDQRQSIKPEPT